jgi:hypothetical protein
MQSKAERESRIFVICVGALMAAIIGFGILELLGVIHV